MTDDNLSELITKYLSIFPENGKLRVLLIDDDPLVGDYLGSFLRRAAPAMTLEQVRTVDKAEAVINERPDSIDFLIIDLRMGEREGVEMMQSLKDTRRYYPFVVYSGEHATFEQRQVIKILRRLNQIDQIRAEIMNGSVSFAADYISKEDPLELLLLEMLYRNHVYSIRHKEVFEAMIEKFTPEHPLEDPEQFLIKLLVETTATGRNMLSEFLHVFEEDPLIAERELNQTAAEVLAKERGYHKKTFTSTTRAYYLGPEGLNSKPLLAYTNESAKQWLKENPSQFMHHLKRYRSLFRIRGTHNPRAIASFYGRCRGMEDEERDDGYVPFTEQEKPAFDLLDDFHKRAGIIGERTVLLGEALLDGMGVRDFCKLYDLEKIRSYLSERGISFSNHSRATHVHFTQSGLYHTLDELARNARAANATDLILEVEAKPIDEAEQYFRVSLEKNSDYPPLKGADTVLSLSLSDDGHGFKDTEKALDWHYSTTDSRGLGLPLAKRTVEASSGQLKIGNFGVDEGAYVQMLAWGN